MREHEGVHLGSNETQLFFAEYVKFHNPPPDGQHVDTIVVMGTSRITAPISFDMRVRTALEYSDSSPQATVIFSGKEASADKAHPEETGPQYIESAVMAAEAVTRGLQPERIRLETDAKNAKENVINSLSLLAPQEEKVLFISSGYLGRRIDLYLKKQNELGNIPGEKKFFIVDADVQEDASSKVFTEQDLNRKRTNLLYEASRIQRYRLKGDL